MTFRFYAGKGGVGKTTCAAAAALEVAATGEIFLNCPPARAVLPPLDR